MNEKIHALAEQAGYSSWELNPTKETMSEIDHAARLTAFAELIVQESCKIVLKYHIGSDDYDYVTGEIASDIKEHFGIK